MNNVNKLGVHPKGECWWCGEIADSAEHMIKKSDVKRMFSEKEPEQPILAIRYSESGEGFPEQNIVQGPNSGYIKFSRILCSKCNNAKSQPFDKSFSIFSDYISKNQEKILTDLRIDFRKVYGRYWSNETFNLGKYLLKHIGCRIADSGIAVPKSILEYMNCNIRKFPYVHIGFCVDRKNSSFSDELSLYTKESHSILELTPIAPEIREWNVETAFGFEESRQILANVSGAMYLGILKVEWLVPFQEIVNPFTYPFRSPKYELKHYDSVSTETIQSVMARHTDEL